ncbi:hypothetical protein BDZ45DRAFT_718280 [Acephala macrosclerotiorum]|nr:hypothetical protein BDZ45DRAFT_718280 [Acephala macrosclerotiorum]
MARLTRNVFESNTSEQSTVSPPPLSPRTLEKKHHTRRKSGKDYVATSERKSSRSAPLSRKTTPQFITKTPSGSGRLHREREDEERGRDSGESFPQFCMTCEKQFLPANNTFLYCSEACRLHDQAPPPPTIRTNSYSAYGTSPPPTPHTRYFSSYPSASHSLAHEEGPDIIPRFSPTQSRPRSYFNSDPYPSSSYQPPPSPERTQSSSTALASLRELATALPKSSRERREPESPPKSSASSISRTGSGVWNYIPFTSSNKTSTPTPSATPGNSYTQPSHQYNSSQSYGNGYTQSGSRSREDLYNYGKSHGQVTTGYGYTASGATGMDRPLPPRSGPGGYGHRPKSIDLVTPFSGH